MPVILLRRNVACAVVVAVLTLGQGAHLLASDSFAIAANRRAEIGTSDGDAAILRLPDEDADARIIVEFVERPLLERRGSRAASTTSVASETHDSLMARLEADIDRIE